MPYSKINDLPDMVKALPAKAQRIWMDAFNTSSESGGEETESIKIAWSAVGNVGYIKNSRGKWIKASRDGPLGVLQVMSEFNFDMLGDGSADNSINGQIPILRKSKFQHPWYGEMSFDDKFFTDVINNFYANTLGFEPSIDVAHDPDLGAVGWVKDLKYDNDVLTLMVQMLPEGLDLVQTEKFKYASMSLDSAYVDSETGQGFGPVLLGAALTNRPFIHRQEQVALLSMDGKAEYSPGSVIVFSQPELDDIKNQEEIVENKDKNAENTEVVSEPKPLMSISPEDFKALTIKVQELELTAAKAKELEGERDALSQQVVTLQAKYEQSENDKLLANARIRVKDGKSLAPVIIDFAARLLSGSGMGDEDAKVELSANSGNLKDWLRTAVKEMLLSFPYTLPVESNDTGDTELENPSHEDIEAQEKARADAVTDFYNL